MAHSSPLAWQNGATCCECILEKSVTECPEHGSQKNTQQCAFFASTAGRFVRPSAEYVGAVGRLCCRALWAADGQKMSCKQQVVLFAAVADAVSWLLMSHLHKMYFK